MKNFWKALGIAAIAAAVVPVKVKKDEESGKKKFQSLLLSVDVDGDAADQKFDIGVNFGEGVLSGAIASVVTKKEDAMFADDEPEAAVVGDVIDFAEASKAHADPEGEVADESDFVEDGQAEDAGEGQDMTIHAAIVKDDEDDAFDPEA